MMTPDEIRAAKEDAEYVLAHSGKYSAQMWDAAYDLIFICDTALTAIAERDAAYAMLREARPFVFTCAGGLRATGKSDAWEKAMQLLDAIDTLLKDKSE